MKTAVLFLSLLASGIARADEQGSALTEIRYSVRDGSRLTLGFSAPAGYVATREGDRYILHFAQTGVAPYPGAARLKFVDGLLQGVTVERLRPEGCRVVLTVRPGSEVDLPSAGTATRMALLIRPVKARNEALPLPSLAKPVSGLRVDSPVAVSEPEGAVLSPSRGTPGQPSEPRRSGTSLLLVAAAILSSAVSTVLIMALVVRGARRQKKGVQGDPISDSSAGQEAEVLTEVPPHQSPGFGPSVQDVVAAGDPREEETLHLSVAFHREPAEIDLARRLRGGGAHSGVGEKLRQFGRSRPGRRQRVAAAKRWGIGLGEVDLATRLEAVASRADREEATR